MRTDLLAVNGISKSFRVYRFRVTMASQNNILASALKDPKIITTEITVLNIAGSGHLPSFKSPAPQKFQCIYVQTILSESGVPAVKNTGLSFFSNSHSKLRQTNHF